MTLKLPLFEEFCPLNVKECVEGLNSHQLLYGKLLTVEPFYGRHSICSLSEKNQLNWALGLLFSKFNDCKGKIVYKLFLFFPNFSLIVHNKTMICNTRNWGNDKQQQNVSKKKRPILILIF